MRFRNSYGQTEPQAPLDDVSTTARLQAQGQHRWPSQPMLIGTHDAHHASAFLVLLLTELGGAVNGSWRNNGGFLPSVALRAHWPGSRRSSISSGCLLCLHGRTGITKPSDDLAGVVTDGKGAQQKTPIITVSTAHGKCVLPRPTVFKTLSDARDDAIDMVGMMHLLPSPALHLFECGPGIVVPTSIVPVPDRSAVQAN
jgi:hypothetical protein